MIIDEEANRDRHSTGISPLHHGCSGDARAWVSIPLFLGPYSTNIITGPVFGGQVNGMGLVEYQVELLEATQVEVTGSERVGDIDCYALEVTLDLEQLWQLNSLLTATEARDVTEEYLQEILHSFSVK